jgi:hypothetical protein
MSALRTRRSVALAAAIMSIGLLAGCSSGSGGEAATTEEAPANATQMLPPIIVEPGQTEATAVVGDFIDIVVDEVAGTTIATPNADILEIYQAREEEGVVYNPGAKALAPGNAVITVTLPDNTSYDITVTVTE